MEGWAQSMSWGTVSFTGFRGPHNKTQTFAPSAPAWWHGSLLAPSLRAPVTRKHSCLIGNLTHCPAPGPLHVLLPAAPAGFVLTLQ